MEVQESSGLGKRSYYLAEQYHVGQPVAMYEMYPRWVTILLMCLGVLMLPLIGLFICALVNVMLVVVRINVINVQFLVDITGQRSPSSSTAIGESFSPILFVIIVLFLFGVVFFALRGFALGYPISLLVCTGGLLRIRGEKVEAIFWDEVTGIEEREKGYRLMCRKRRPIVIVDVKGDMEELMGQIREYAKVSKNG